MRDRSALIDAACAAMIDGDTARCTVSLNRFRDSVSRRPLSEFERAACGRKLERLKLLAEAACGGIAAAQAWLSEMIDTTGRLDIYDRSGKQRVSTELSGEVQRF